MEETTQTMQFDTEKFMKRYGQLSQNRLEADVAKSYAAQVKKDVSDAQDRADLVVNALTRRDRPPDFAAARNALGLLARGPAVVVAHWQPFIALIAEVLPPRDESETESKVVDSAAETVELKDLRAMFGQVGAVLPVASARDLRELREGFSMLGNAIGAEFAKRGMAFERDGSAAVLERLNAELDVASKPEPLPKGFAFSDVRVMDMRAHLDGQREQLVEADAARREAVTARADLLLIVSGMVRPGMTYVGKPGTLAEAVGMVQSMSVDHDTAIIQMGKTRDEMAKAADGAVARADAAETKLVEAVNAKAVEIDEQVVKPLVQTVAEVKRRAGEVEHEFEEFKKHHKKPKCG